MGLNPVQFGGTDGNEYTAPNGRTYTMHRTGSSMVEAHTPSGRRAGALTHFGGSSTSEPEATTIHKIVVSGPHRRKGVGTAMLDYARLQTPDLHHSQALTEDGQAYASASPREWQPKLPLSPETRGGPNGGEGGPSPWKSYVDFGPKNQRSNERYAAEQAARRNPPTSGPLGIQGRLF